MPTNTIDPTKIAREIKTARINKELTQQQLAELAGLSLRSIQRIEAAEGSPRKYTLTVLAEKLDIAETQLFDNEALPAIHQIGPELTITKERTFNRAQKIIASISLAMLIILITTAYIFQSATFPESAFEMVVLLAALVAVYGGMLVRIWR